MYTLIASYEYSNDLESAIGEVLAMGISEKDVFIVPMDKRAESPRLFDSMHASDGKSLLDLAAILGAIGMLLGVIYGFVLEWGPILWALIGLIFGAILGFFIDLAVTSSKRRHQRGKRNQTELLLFILCPPYLYGRVEQLLWEHQALSLAKLERGRLIRPRS